ncbi:MAG TPA: adenylate/guanylate cyclase domain-containing protein [Gaiellaceae bacterium]
MWACASCDQENPDGFKFCGSCGAPLAVPAPAREVRKVVTIVFCDLTGSTALGDRTDPETLRATMRGYYDEMRTILERHGGTVEKFVGDAVMAVFGVPVSREDDALRAVRAAWEMRTAVGELGLQARIGVNTGEVVAGEGDTLVTGDAVNVAARLEQAAEPGEVLIGTETHRHVRDAATVEPVQVTAKGKPEPIAALRVVDLDLEASGIARRLDTPLVGRERELALLRQTYDTAAREQSCHLFTLLGPAGVGKSRLVAELLDDLEARIVRGRCLDYGEGITFWPVIEVLKQLGAESAVEAIATGSVSSNELFLTVRRALEDAAQGGPLVVVFEDIHWGEPTFLDLLDHISDLSRGAAILLLCIARPELLDDRPGWGGGKLNATTALLRPLTAEESNALLAGLDAGEVSDETRSRIVESAAGNPLFVEEMLALAREGGDIHAPSTIQALLQARLDRLGTAERSVIERGSVEGELFHRGAVQELGNGGDGLDSQLVALVRKELIRPERGTLPDDDAYRFRHLLIRDVAYDGLPKETRADLHLRFADWLSAHVDLIELDEIVGYHLEQAARYRAELGRPDPELDARAGQRLAAAGSKASARGDLPAADNLLARALTLLPASDPLRPAALLERVVARDNSGDFEVSSALIAELESHPDDVVRMNGTMARLQLRFRTDPHSVVEEARRVSGEALELFAAAGDDLGTARAWYLLFWVDWLQSRAQPALAALEQAILHADRAGAGSLASSANVYLMGPLLHGPFTPDDLRLRLEPLRERGGPLAINTVLRVEAHLLRLEGRFAEALDAHARSDELSADLGMDMMRAVMQQWPAEVMLLQGIRSEAVAIMRDSVARLEEYGETSFRSTCIIRLAHALYLAGDAEEAEQLAIEGEELGAAEDFVNYAIGREIRARIASDHGAHDDAEALARDALEYAYKTDFPWVHAQVHTALAYVLAANDRTEEARAELETALDRHLSYGNTFEAERTRQLLVEL